MGVEEGVGVAGGGRVRRAGTEVAANSREFAANSLETSERPEGWAEPGWRGGGACQRGGGAEGVGVGWVEGAANFRANSREFAANSWKPARPEVAGWRSLAASQWGWREGEERTRVGRPAWEFWKFDGYHFGRRKW